jgi:carboxylesterase type B
MKFYIFKIILIESAGAVSVSYHMLSPMSKDLFQRAISNSGSIYNSRADPWRKNEALEAAKRLANVLDCPSTNGSAIVTCLRTKNAVDIILAADEASWSNRAVIEDFEGLTETAFLPKRAFVKESVNIPWMVGMNQQEGLIFTEKLFNSEALRNERIQSWNEELPKSLDYDHVDDGIKSIITKKITQFYFGTDALTEGFSIQNLTDVIRKIFLKLFNH